MAEDLNAEELWGKMAALLHKGDLNPSLWAAVEAVTPLTVADDTVIVALAPGGMQHAGYIETARNKAQLQALLAQICGQRLNVRVITGTSLADWERVREREALGVATVTEQVRARSAQKGARATWSEGAEKVFAIFTGARARARGTDLARLMRQAVAAMCEVEDSARALSPDDEELHDQQLNRIVDRVATYCSVPPTVVGLECLRHRSSRD